VTSSFLRPSCTMQMFMGDEAWKELGDVDMEDDFCWHSLLFAILSRPTLKIDPPLHP
jgi:hypothetical protein